MLTSLRYPTRSRTDGQGLAGLPHELLGAVVRAAWWEAYAMRAAIHRLVGIHHCDVHIRSGELRLGAGPGWIGSDHVALGDARLHIGGDCPCRDYVTDLFVEIDQFLARSGGALVNPPGAVRRHIRTRLAGDWIRRRRIAMGAQARTDRIRDSARARLLPDDFHRAVLEYLADEAGSLAPLDGDEQLHARLAERAAAEFGGTHADHRGRVRAALPVIETACRGGPTSDPGSGWQLTWWERYIEQPMGRRACRRDVELDALHAAAPEFACAAAEQAFDEIDARVDAVDHRSPAGSRPGVAGPESAIVAALFDLPPRGLGPAVRAAVLGLAERGVLPARVARDFVADPCRVAAAVAALRAERSA